MQTVVNGNVFSIEENTFYFGSVVPTQNPEGVSERIKIVNIGKVPAAIRFEIAKKAGMFAFDVTPKSIRINPHESAYIKLSFRPEIMAMYEGAFKAIVENGDQSFPGCKLIFELKGEGTLPSLNLLSDSLYTGGPEPVLDFGKVRIDRGKKA